MPRRKKLDLVQAEKLEAELIKTMTGLMVTRDNLNQLIGALRTSARRLQEQITLVKKVGDHGERPAIAEAYQMIFGLTAYLLTTMEEILPAQLLAHVLKVPEAPKKAKPRKQTSKKGPPPSTPKPKSPPSPKAPVKEPPVEKSEGEKPAKKVKRYGVMPQAANTLRLAFGGETIPQTLVEILPAVYGENWQSQKIGGMLKGQRGPVTRMVVEDLSLPDSILRAYLASGYLNLLRYEQESPEGQALARSELVKLYQTISEKHTLNTVELTLRNWGVPIP